MLSPYQPAQRQQHDKAKRPKKDGADAAAPDASAAAPAASASRRPPLSGSAGGGSVLRRASGAHLKPHHVDAEWDPINVSWGCDDKGAGVWGAPIFGSLLANRLASWLLPAIRFAGRPTVCAVCNIPACCARNSRAHVMLPLPCWSALLQAQGSIREADLHLMQDQFSGAGDASKAATLTAIPTAPCNPAYRLCPAATVREGDPHPATVWQHRCRAPWCAAAVRTRQAQLLRQPAQLAGA